MLKLQFNPYIVTLGGLMQERNKISQERAGDIKIVRTYRRQSGKGEIQDRFTDVQSYTCTGRRRTKNLLFFGFSSSTHPTRVIRPRNIVIYSA